ncbi:hypothetical protein MNBD_GAMMA26-644 [hydrothermal vent metagenome]|uniref:DUF7939 domain-containing protein n=1 Tax=hydrothermal vent metagenome TaxID=652676 RepID=A0A3B1AJD1_9ZZZZ
MNTYKKIIILLVLAIALLLQATHAISATITTKASRNPVTIDETFELIFQATGSPDGDPDFRPLEKNFEILGNSRSESIQMINGDYSRTTSWTISVMAKTTGNLTIPAIAFGSDRSQAATIQVQKTAETTPGSADQDIFLEITVEPQTAYVQQQLVYHVRIYRAVNISDASLTAPHFNDPDVIVEQLGEEQSFETQRNGKRYLVSQIDYAVFPQTSGTLTLDPVIFQARTSQHSRNQRQFGFGSSPFSMTGPMRRYRSEAINVEVKPMPESGGTPWLPTTNLQLSAVWPKSQPEFRVGEPVTRTLMVFADGLTSAQLPEINAKIPAGFKQYPDQPAMEDRNTSSGITGIRQEKVAIVPTKAGSHTLPPIEITWWDIKTNRKQTARIPETQIQVLPAEGAAAEPVITAPITIANPAKTVKEQAVPDENEAPAYIQQEHSMYRWLSLFLSLGWLSTAIAWWWLRKRYNTQPEIIETEPSHTLKSRQQCLADLKHACQTNHPQAARTAILDWGATQWVNSPPQGLTDIASRLDGQAAQQIQLLEQTLYAKDSSTWEGGDLWKTIQNLTIQPITDKDSDEALVRLYP